MNGYTTTIIEVLSNEQTEVFRMAKWKLWLANWLDIPLAPLMYDYELKVVVDNPDPVLLSDVFMVEGKGRFFCSEKYDGGFKEPLKAVVIVLHSLTPLPDGLEYKCEELIFITRTFSEG